MVDDELWVCERKFWLDGANFHKERVAPDALLLLPAARGIPRWFDVKFSRRHSLLAAADTAVLAYVARAEDGCAAQPYYAHCSSTYVRVRRSWMLAAHQQCAVENPDDALTERGALALFFAD